MVEFLLKIFVNARDKSYAFLSVGNVSNNISARLRCVSFHFEEC